MLTFARRNPDAFWKWAHQGTDQRHYRAEAVLPEVQLQLVEAIALRSEILEREDNLRKSFAQLSAEAEHWKMDAEQRKMEAGYWRVEAARRKADAERCQTAIGQWNGRSWIARALHKLRVGTGNSGSEDK